MKAIRGEEMDVTTYLERKEEAGPVPPKVGNRVSDSDEKKQRIIELLRNKKLTSGEIAETVGVSPPTVWAYKANLTMGKYDTSDIKDHVKEDPSTDWEPDREAGGSPHNE